MLNIIFVSDDIDAEIGTNCSLAHNHLINHVDLAAENTVLLCGNSCTAEEVANAIASFDGQRFLLVAFSHGCAEALLSTASADGYVTKANCYLFGTSLVYTNCCHSGITLKGDLIEAGCSGYVGYTDEVRLPHNETDDILFIACENRGLINFLTTKDTLTKSIDVMESAYMEQYQKFIDQNMNVAASQLIHNMRCLTYQDDHSLTRAELEN